MRGVDLDVPPSGVENEWACRGSADEGETFHETSSSRSRSGADRVDARTDQPLETRRVERVTGAERR
ncbi:MAG: hypothetical protein M5T61_16625 [Acidimicrobiia bacterium]|jgi:hypothetical protein|nr:hypothetical protein [Acidimicrobiia bacterium]